MRAIFCELDNEAATGSEVLISGDRAHHLQVVRIKLDEDILVLNGKGKRFCAKVVSITKKAVGLKVLKVESIKLKHQINLAIALPKKDAFEDILKFATELGINTIYPLTSEFSQYTYEPSERLERIIENALVQSNNLFLPRIAAQTELGDFLENDNGSLIYFSSIPTVTEKKIKDEGPMTVLIGPEAGFSSGEDERIRAYKNIKIIHLPTPILRAPTAVATSVGYLLGSIT